jgi:hypothetical protein
MIAVIKIIPQLTLNVKRETLNVKRIKLRQSKKLLEENSVKRIKLSLKRWITHG